MKALRILVIVVLVATTYMWFGPLSALGEEPQIEPVIKIVDAYATDESMLERHIFRAGQRIYYHIVYTLVGDVERTEKEEPYFVKGIVLAKEFNLLSGLPENTKLIAHSKSYVGVGHIVIPGLSDCYSCGAENPEDCGCEIVPSSASGGVKIKCKVKAWNGGATSTDKTSYSIYVRE